MQLGSLLVRFCLGEDASIHVKDPGWYLHVLLRVLSVLFSTHMSSSVSLLDSFSCPDVYRNPPLNPGACIQKLRTVVSFLPFSPSGVGHSHYVALTKREENPEQFSGFFFVVPCALSFA